MTREAKVAIVGGGIAGAVLALRLAQVARLAPPDICLFERAPPQAPVADDAPEQRVYALSPASIALLQDVGAWDRLDLGRISPIEQMHVCAGTLPADSPDVLRFDAAESGMGVLGVIAGARALQSALLDQCRDAGVHIVTDAVESLQLQPAPVVGTAAGQCHAELLVGADGTRSTVRAAAGIGVKERDYGQLGIVATVRPARPRPALAFQRFLPTGPLALLPLPGGLLSIVWSAVRARAEALLALDDAAFSAELTACAASGFGDLVACGPRAAFALRRIRALRYVSGACVLVGDAAHAIHPLAGQGLNQGLADVRALADALAQRPAGEGVAAMRALRRYERRQLSDNARMGAVVDTLDRLFTGSGLLAGLAGRGMGMVGGWAPARRLLTRGAAGRSSLRR